MEKKAQGRWESGEGGQTQALPNQKAAQAQKGMSTESEAWLILTE